ncbi:MAG: hypothetical protein AAFV45_11410 [Pseudomonadota bacterium]
MGSAQDYTPAEMLQFGQRAEAEGDYDYALRAYAYLVEQYRDSDEGQIAYESYLRVEHRTGGLTTSLETSSDPDEPHSSVPGSVQSDVPVDNADLTSAAAFPDELATSDGLVSGSKAPSGGPDRLSARLADLHEGLQASLEPSTLEPQHLDDPDPDPLPVSLPTSVGEIADDDADAQLPRIMRAIEDEDGDLETAFRRKYRVGGFVAGCLAVLGWIAILAGFAMVIAAYLTIVPEVVATGVELSGGAGYLVGFVVAGSGLGLLFISQLGHAIFDNANATRQLLAIERAKAGY